jgi:hypothetical protein
MPKDSPPEFCRQNPDLGDCSDHASIFNIPLQKTRRFRNPESKVTFASTLASFFFGDTFGDTKSAYEGWDGLSPEDAKSIAQAKAKAEADAAPPVWVSPPVHSRGLGASAASGAGHPKNRRVSAPISIKAEKPHRRSRFFSDEGSPPEPPRRSRFYSEGTTPPKQRKQRKSQSPYLASSEPKNNKLARQQYSSPPTDRRDSVFYVPFPATSSQTRNRIRAKSFTETFTSFMSEEESNQRAQERAKEDARKAREEARRRLRESAGWS